MKIKVTLNKADRTVEIDTDKMDPKGLEYLVEYGLKQSLNDAASAVSADDPDCKAKAAEAADARLAKILAGTIDSRTVTRLDPVFKEARQILTKALVKAGLKTKDLPAMPDWAEFEKVAKKYKAPISKIKAKAQEIVDAKGADEIELSI